MPDRKRSPLADVPPAQFVAARDALVRELRAQGKAAEARTVAALRRPSVPVWVVNQLARRDPAAVDKLIDVTRRLAAAQAGGGGLRELMEEQRKLLAGLSADAEKVLAEAGVRGAPELERRVRATLQGAAAREPQKLRGGELEEELEPLGFGELSGTEDAERAAEPRMVPPATEDRAAAGAPQHIDAKDARKRGAQPRAGGPRAPDERAPAVRERTPQERAADQREARERLSRERRAESARVAAERERAAQERKAAATAGRERAARQAQAQRTAAAAERNAKRLARRAADAERAAARAAEAAAKANETAATARAAAADAARIAEETRAIAEKP